jgi:hypothetical protein
MMVADGLQGSNIEAGRMDSGRWTIGCDNSLDS